MGQIGAFEVLGTLALIVLAVVVVLLFILAGWFVVWKLILSHFRFFREILGMEHSEELEDFDKAKKPDRPKTTSQSEIPAHLRRRQQREAEQTARYTEISSTNKTPEKKRV